MDVLVLIDKLDDLVHNAKLVPMTGQVRVDKDEIYDILDQMRATIPEEIKQARWIVKERQEMLAEAKREAERIVKEARERQDQLVGEEEVTKQAERAAEDIIEDARAREREIRLGAEDYADEILNTLEVNLSKFIAAVQRGRERLQGKDEPAEVRVGRAPRARRRGAQRIAKLVEALAARPARRAGPRPRVRAARRDTTARAAATASGSPSKCASTAPSRRLRTQPRHAEPAGLAPRAVAKEHALHVARGRRRCGRRARPRAAAASSSGSSAMSWNTSPPAAASRRRPCRARTPARASPPRARPRMPGTLSSTTAVSPDRSPSRARRAGTGRARACRARPRSR